MHSLKLVHRDIKPLNVAWSPTFKRWIFLDFGFSTILQENFGEKTYTKFIGTFNYTIDELQSLFLFGEKGAVNFYKNDEFGLKKSIKIILEEIKARKEKEKEKEK